MFATPHVIRLNWDMILGDCRSRPVFLARSAFSGVKAGIEWRSL
jgi:hypothetical protein